MIHAITTSNAGSDDAEEEQRTLRHTRRAEAESAKRQESQHEGSGEQPHIAVGEVIAAVQRCECSEAHCRPDHADVQRQVAQEPPSLSFSARRHSRHGDGVEIGNPDAAHHQELEADDHKVDLVEMPARAGEGDADERFTDHDGRQTRQTFGQGVQGWSPGAPTQRRNGQSGPAQP